MARPKIVLASASPRRRDLLREHGYNAEIHPANIDEVMPAHLTVGETTLYNAKLKATLISRARPDTMVLGADTLVAINGKILGKPRDRAEAFEMLSLLSGRAHEVFSGVWLAHARGRRAGGFIEVSRVRFHELSPERIRDYMNAINPLDKAGAYAAQHEGSTVIESVEGSFTNVVGLPMERLEKFLADFLLRDAAVISSQPGAS